MPWNHFPQIQYIDFSIPHQCNCNLCFTKWVNKPISKKHDGHGWLTSYFVRLQSDTPCLYVRRAYKVKPCAYIWKKPTEWYPMITCEKSLQSMKCCAYMWKKAYKVIPHAYMWEEPTKWNPVLTCVKSLQYDTSWVHARRAYNVIHHMQILC